MRRPAIRWAVLATAVLVGGCGGPEPSASPTEPPIGQPNVACLGVPQAPCDDAVKSLEGMFDAPIVRISVACTVPACTATDGQVSIDVLLANGRRENSGYGYGIAQPQPAPVEPPVLTVVPICLGLPITNCRDMALTMLQEPGFPGEARPAIARITVRCTAVCGPASGDGETRIDYVDGTNATTTWGYTNNSG